MANNSTSQALWNFSLPLIINPSSNPIEHQHHSHHNQQQQQQQQQQPPAGDRKQRTLRLSINARERRRMHDLNDALDELRSVVCFIEFYSN